MESLWHHIMAWMITYLSVIYSIHCTCMSSADQSVRESSFSVISLIEAVQWSYQSHCNQEEIKLLNICHRDILVLIEHLKRVKL